MKKEKLTPEQKEANRLARKEERERAKELAKQQEAINQPEVKSLLITIEWRKSRIWGSNPHATAEITYKEPNAGPWGTGFYKETGFTCSGCGYDKESTVIAEIYNKFMKHRLWKLSAEAMKGGRGSGDKGSAPYGITAYEYKGVEHRNYGGGIGTSCYPRISEYIGGQFDCIASGKTFDVYKFTSKE